MRGLGATLWLVFICAAGSAGAQTQLSRIEGVVLGPDTGPVGGAVVTLQDPLGAGLHSVTTASDGRFVISGVAPGRYMLRVDAPGLQPVVRPIAIDDALPALVELQLPPPLTETVVVRPSESVESVASRVSLAAGSLDQIPVRTRSRAVQDIVATLPGWSAEDNGLLHSRGVDDGFLYVIDGLPVYERLDALSGLPPDTSLVASLNVVTGYVPPEFGFKTGGVIEIQSAAGGSRWTGTAQVGGGSDATWDGSATAGGPLGTRANVLLGASGLQSQRFLDPVHPENLHNDGNAVQASAHLAWRPGDADVVTARGGHGRSSFEVPHGAVQDEAGQDQRQRIAQRFVDASWQRTWSGATVTHLAAYRRTADAALIGSLQDAPLFANAARAQTRTGLLASIAHQRGAHVLKLGTELMALRLSERFDFAVTDEEAAVDAGLSDRILAFRPHAPFSFTGAAAPTLWSLYVQNSWRPQSRVALDAGIRFDRIALLAPTRAWSPRAGAAFRLNDRTSVRASLSRFVQPPQAEHLLLASSVEARVLSPFEVEGHEGGADIQPERQLAFEAGFERRFGETLRVDAAYWRRRARHASDPNIFFGTTIVFPNTVARGRADGLDLRVEAQRRRGWSGYLSYTASRVIQTGPVTGGLFLEDEIAEIGPGAEFVPDHDQRHVAAAGLTFEHERSGIWLSVAGRYQSGTPIQREDEDDLAARPGAEVVNFDSGRVKPRGIVDLLAAIPVRRTGGIALSVRASLLNLFDHRYAFNFGNPFSGTHFGPPRTASVSVRVSFH